MQIFISSSASFNQRKVFVMNRKMAGKQNFEINFENKFLADVAYPNKTPETLIK